MRASFRPLPSQDDLNAHFNYNPKTGELTRKNGKMAGCKRYRKNRRNEPWMIYVNYKSIQYAAHRIIWKMVTGNDPAPLTIDHVDRNPFNNKWSNLRLADRSIQSQNREWKTTMGSKGVSFHKATRKWQARIRDGEKRVHLGVYETKEKAIKAQKEYEKLQRAKQYTKQLCIKHPDANPDANPNTVKYTKQYCIQYPYSNTNSNSDTIKHTKPDSI